MPRSPSEVGISFRPAVGAENDPYAQQFSDTPPPDQPQAAPSPVPAAADEDYYAQQFSDAPPPPPQQPPREIGRAEAGVKGIANALTFGTAPAIAGLAEASGIPSAAPEGGDGIDVNPVRPVLGAAKLLHAWYTGHPDPEVRAAYDRGRKSYLADQQAAQDQHFWPYMAGQLGGALMTPMGFAGAAENVGARTLGTIATGGVGGGLYGAGDAIGQGENATDAAIAGAKGAATGGAFGLAAGAGGAALGKVYDRAAQIVRGHVNPDAEAAARIVGAAGKDYDKLGPAFTPEEAQVANAAGVPRVIADQGGENMRALARSAANTSADAREALNEAVSPRFAEQGQRVGGFIRNITGGANADALEQKLQNDARAQNGPAYQRLFAANPVVNVPASITSRPVVQQAMRDAVSLAKNYGEKLEGAPELRTVLAGDGYHIADDVANPAKTSLQYWDYVKKALDRRITGILKKGGIDTLDSAEKADLGGLIDAKNSLLDHLDATAKGYKEVRQGAAAFFGAENALDAGRQFVMHSADLNAAQRAIAKFTPAERELFARGFASDLADKLEKVGFNQNVLNSAFVNNGPARQKILMALGPDRARQLEVLFRVESLVNRTRQAVQGNSSTLRQSIEHGLAGGGAVASYEALKDHSLDANTIIIGAFAAGGAKAGVKAIDERVATRVGEMLASSDPRILQQGLALVQKSPVLFAQLRKATNAGVRVGAQDVGPDQAAAGAAALGQRIYEGPEDEGHHRSSQDSLLDQVR